jgi:2-dehydropantoate 2-reductase
MRFVIYGAGAIGGAIGGRLFEAGHDVTLIARGAHADVLRQRGLELASAAGSAVLPVPTVEHPSEAALQPDDVVILAMKSQDTPAAVTALSTAAPAGIAVVCAQNGVENERVALRSFERVYGMGVMCPASHLEPGRVLVHSTPISGLLDLGPYPVVAAGSTVDDPTAEGIAAALRSATFESYVLGDIMRWKYRKLMMNLANAAVALCGPVDELAPLVRRLRVEGEACLAAAGIDAATVEEDRARRDGKLTTRPIDGSERHGGSSWQSLARGLGSIETDYLSGEIVLLGRLHGVPTPANTLLQHLANQAAAEHRPPGSTTVAEILAQLPPADA